VAARWSCWPGRSPTCWSLVILSGFTLAYGKLVVRRWSARFRPVRRRSRRACRWATASLRWRQQGRHVPRHQDDRGPASGRAARHGGRARGQAPSLPITPTTRSDADRFGNVQKIGFIGIGPASVQVVRVGPVDAVIDGGRQMAGIVDMMVTGIGQIVTGKREVRELGGPIKIAKFSGEQLVSGWQPFVFFVALISINLGFINLLPIPVLDGGHLAFYLAEAVFRRPVSARTGMGISDRAGAGRGAHADRHGQ
jgi:regulator of sigma E protease